MNSIKIEFNNQLFRQLVQLVYLGRWMIASHEKEDTDNSMKEVEQHIYKQANTLRLNELIEFDPVTKQYSPTSFMEEQMTPMIQEYDDFTFWDELAWQMAERDFSKKYDQTQIMCMTDDEIFREKNILADKYIDEFSANGLDNFKIIK